MTNTIEKIIYNPDPETPISIEGNLIRADWYNAGEGLWGDYDSSDPDDVNLLRFDIYRKEGNEWEEVDDASYCTVVPADTDMTKLTELLKYIYKQYDEALQGNPEASVKKLGEYLSWITA